MFRPRPAFSLRLLLRSPLSLRPAAKAQAPIRVSVNEVIVPVTVTDDKGRFVSNLTKSDFHDFRRKQGTENRLLQP